MYVQLAVENITYLHDAVAAQLDTGTIKRVHPREEVPINEQVHSGEKGRSMCYRGSLRGWLRARYTDTCESKIKNVFVKPVEGDVNGAELVDKAINTKRQRTMFEFIDDTGGITELIDGEADSPPLVLTEF